MNLPSSSRSPARPPAFRPPSAAPWAGLALLLFVVALLGFGAALDGYSQTIHPVALLGARGVPHWYGFDALGFVLPGLLAWWAMVQAGRAMEHKQAGGEFGLVGRIGWTLCTISTLAFALEGLLPVDAARGLGYGLGRLHTAAWTVWWIAFVAGAVALIAGAGAHTGLRRTRIATAIAAIVVLASVVVAIPGAPALGQRIAFVAWFAWIFGMARASSR
ncbi:DUF998 domain-containing protein [Lysobacter sp. KIS68-7]|uniref:DUF998 domain-containing protein n=1 Tax=Lysobacter sp. KIS68-7 TaxID=2904252 RepID=UPI001E289BF4|nr:DUF998 domain-containing protein [Lysobacter sp. KIS68-7]UHQ19467.1 DUF998 domain-containing protein [Lysobacter sp. KIS68-7]